MNAFSRGHHALGFAAGSVCALGQGFVLSSQSAISYFRSLPLIRVDYSASSRALGE